VEQELLTLPEYLSSPPVDGPIRKCSIPYADLKPCLMNVSLTFDRVVIAYQTIMNLVYMAYVLVPIVRRV
jgi:hypothetical protein